MVDRAARHGHQLNGKLARLAQHEAAQLSTSMSDNLSSSVSGSTLVGHCPQKNSPLAGLGHQEAAQLSTLMLNDLSGSDNGSTPLEHRQRKNSPGHRKKKKKKSLKRSGTEES